MGSRGSGEKAALKKRKTRQSAAWCFAKTSSSRARPGDTGFFRITDERPPSPGGARRSVRRRPPLGGFGGDRSSDGRSTRFAASSSRSAPWATRNVKSAAARRSSASMLK